MRILVFMVVIPFMLLSACNESEKSNRGTSGVAADSKVSPASDVSKEDKTSDYKGLTPEYLLGAWCYTHYQSINPDTKAIDREENNYNFIFETDGTYSTQGASTAKMQPGWKYEFLPDEVFKLKSLPETNKVVSVQPDAFVLHNFVDHYFQRGACK